jgi:hypothetical protein
LEPIKIANHFNGRMMLSSTLEKCCLATEHQLFMEYKTTKESSQTNQTQRWQIKKKTCFGA